MQCLCGYPLCSGDEGAGHNLTIFVYKKDGTRLVLLKRGSKLCQKCVGYKIDKKYKKFKKTYYSLLTW